MKFRPACWLNLFFASVALFLSGCGQLLDRQLEDDKDPNFIDGRNKVQAADFVGAVESFEKAIFANPKNAAAHFELAWIFEQRHNYSYAIYHYEKHLELKPNSANAGIIKEHINASIQELAKTVAFVVINRDTQKHLDALDRTNATLRASNDSLRALLATRPQYITNWFTNTLYVTNYVAVRQPASPVATPPRPLVNPQATRLPATNAVALRHEGQGTKPTPRPPLPLSRSPWCIGFRQARRWAPSPGGTESLSTRFGL